MYGGVQTADNRLVGDGRVREPTAVRSRLTIDLDAGTVATGGRQVEGAHDRETVLAEYLDLVYLLRDAEPGSPVPIRQLDLEVLARELAWREEEIERELHELMLRTARDPIAIPSPRSRPWWLVAAALVVAALAVGSVAAAQSGSDDEPESPAHEPSVTDTVDIDGAVAYVRDPVTGEIRAVEPGE